MKKLISLLLSMAMVFSMTAVQALAADEETAMLADTGAEGTDAPVAQTVTLDLSKGSIVISKTGYKQGGGDETPFTGAYTIKQSDKSNLTNTISVENGTHQITMNNVDIDVSSVSGACAFSIEAGASVLLKLVGTVTLKSGNTKAGLSVPSGAAVTISADTDSDELTAKGAQGGAGIGGNEKTSGGNITILSGTVNADGGASAAGIGGGDNGTGTGEGESIHISGGMVTATGAGGAGIGGGSYAVGTGHSGQIIIDGTATVIANSINYGAGIGGGVSADGTGVSGKIILRGAANVTAESLNGGGAGIGSGSGISEDMHLTGEYGEVLITDYATVKANSDNATGIGGGRAYYYYNSASSTRCRSYGTGINGRLTISGNANVTASGVTGIGGSGYSYYKFLGYTTGENGVISISDNAVVKATGSEYGIGADNDASENGGVVNIDGGKVVASGIRGCNISGGSVFVNGSLGNAIVNGGVVSTDSIDTLTSDDSGNGWVVSYTQVKNNSMKSGVLFYGNGQIIGNSYTLPADCEIYWGRTMTVEAEQELLIPTDTTLVISGELIVKGKLTVNGTMKVAGTLNTAETGVIAGSGETEITGTVTGKKLPIAIQAQNMSTMEKTFDVSTLFTIPQTAGAAAYTVTKDGTPVELDGTTLSIPDGGVFTVTVATAETEYYQEASATATLTATVHNHQLRAVAAKAATCEESGNIAYWVCDECRKYFRDADGTQVITLEETVLAATEHHFDNGVCTACGAKDPAYETNAVIEAGSLTTYPGDTIKVPISVRNNPGISSIKLTVTYDPAVLGYKGCTFNEALTSIAGSQTVVNDTQSGRVVLSWVVANAAYTDAKGDIAVLDFEVKSVAENTSSPVSISYEPESTFDNNLVDQKFLIKNGTVQVNMIRPGDINGDGTVKVNDALLLNYVCDLRKDEVKGNPDVNGDGAVNNKDVVILLRYIAEVEGITLH